MGIGSNDENCYLENQKGNWENKMSEFEFDEEIEVSDHSDMRDSTHAYFMANLSLSHIPLRGICQYPIITLLKNGSCRGYKYARKIEPMVWLRFIDEDGVSNQGEAYSVTREVADNIKQLFQEQ
jgi:hypothetical protein